jgi:hypothetical protein
LIKDCETLLTVLKINGEEKEKEMIGRTVHLLSKMVRIPAAALQIAEQKKLLFKVMLYFTNDD